MLKCCGCQTNFILSLGGSFLSLKFLPTPSLTGGLVMPIRRTKIASRNEIPLLAASVFYSLFYKVYNDETYYRKKS